MAIGGTVVTAFAEEPAADNTTQHGGKKTASYRQMTDEERAELRAKIFAGLTDEQKAAVIEKMGEGKGASGRGTGYGKIGKGAGQGTNGQGKTGKGGAAGLNHNRANESTVL